jgi:alanine or glycine:cation symporter, AGCS family
MARPVEFSRGHSVKFLKNFKYSKLECKTIDMSLITNFQTRFLNPIKYLVSTLIIFMSRALYAGGVTGEASEIAFFQAFDGFVGQLNGYIGSVLFFNLWPLGGDIRLPFIVVWLVVGAVYCTLKLGFVNIRGFRHAIDVVRGKYHDEKDVGDVTHFQALTAALSATVGLGNIAGVAIAVSLGGPGAVFWMIFAGFLGMSSKFAECTLGQMYREVRPDGTVMGGAMEYLSRGLKEKGFAKTGSFLAVFFCILCIGGSLGGGNAFQVNQSLSSFSESFPWFANHKWAYGLIMAIAVGVVIIGGIRRIAEVASKIVPGMCLIYVLACLYVILSHFSEIPWALGEIFKGAFTPEAGYGGFIGVLIMGFQRAAFSNEAGVGSAAIAHSAAKTKYPAREGVVALLEPFIDTIVVCTMTALVIVISHAYNNPDYETLRQTSQGAALTSRAFGEVLSWFPYILSLATVLFAFSTMISWSYYGERCFTFIAGEKYSMVYKLAFVFVVFISATASAGNVLDFSDLMLLGMAFPNLIGVYWMMGKIKRESDSYMARVKDGKFK